MSLYAVVQFGRWEEALNTLTKMVDDKTPRKALTWAYNSVVSALGKARQLGAAKDLVKGMKSYGECGMPIVPPFS